MQDFCRAFMLKRKCCSRPLQLFTSKTSSFCKASHKSCSHFAYCTCKDDPCDDSPNVGSCIGLQYLPSKEGRLKALQPSCGLSDLANSRSARCFIWVALLGWQAENGVYNPVQSAGTVLQRAQQICELLIPYSWGDEAAPQQLLRRWPVRRLG